MKELETIAFRELKRYKNDEKCIIIDLRSRALYRQGHVEGARNIPYEQLSSVYRTLPKEKMLLLYCERGGTAMLAGKELKQMGYRVKAAVGGYEQET